MNSFQNMKIVNLKLIISSGAIVFLFLSIALILGTGDVTDAQESTSETEIQQINGIDDTQTLLNDNSDIGGTYSSGTNYESNELIVVYHNQMPVLVDDDETGTVDLSKIEPEFLTRGLAVVTEDLASLGVETGGVEIFGGSPELNGYFVRFDDDIDPLELSFQLNDVEGIHWAQPNYIYKSDLAQTNDYCIRNAHECGDNWWIDDINLDAAHNFVRGKKVSDANRPFVAIIEAIDPETDTI